MLTEEERIAKRKAVQKQNYLKKQQERKAKAKQQYDENRTEILEKKKAKRKAKKEVIVDEEPENLIEDEADEESALESADIDEVEFLSKQRKARENFFSSENAEVVSVRPISSIAVTTVTTVEERISKSWFDFANLTLTPAFADHRLDAFFEDHRVKPAFDESFRVKPVFDESFRFKPVFDESFRFKPAVIEIPLPTKEELKFIENGARRIRIDAGKVAVAGGFIGNPHIVKGAGGVALIAGIVEGAIGIGGHLF